MAQRALSTNLPVRVGTKLLDQRELVLYREFAPIRHRACVADEIHPFGGAETAVNIAVTEFGKQRALVLNAVITTCFVIRLHPSGTLLGFERPVCRLLRDQLALAFAAVAGAVAHTHRNLPNHVARTLRSDGQITFLLEMEDGLTLCAIQRDRYERHAGLIQERGEGRSNIPLPEELSESRNSGAVAFLNAYCFM